MQKLNEIIDQFQNADYQETLHLLLDYSEDLQDPPDRILNLINKDEYRVHECQTSVFIWVELTNGIVELFADVPLESPTVRGLVSILINAFNGATPDDIISAPPDLLTKLGLGQKLGTRRMYGLSAVYARIKNEVSKLSYPQ